MRYTEARPEIVPVIVVQPIYPKSFSLDFIYKQFLTGEDDSASFGQVISAANGFNFITLIDSGCSKETCPMPMSKAKKEEEIKEIKEKLEGSGVVVVTHYSGLDVSEMQTLRAKLREQGASFKVTKNTLARLAIQGTDYEKIADLFEGPTGIAVSEDPVAAAKAANDFAKENEKLVIIGGAMGAIVLDAEAVKRLASLPSLDELRSKIIGLVQAPATKVARVLQAPAQQMIGVTAAYGRSGE